MARISKHGALLGRPPGIRNLNSRAGREMAQAFLEDPEYLDSLRARLRAGTLPPAIETLLWYYAYGRPVDRVEISTNDQMMTITKLSSEEIAVRAELLARRMRGEENVDDRPIPASAATITIHPTPTPAAQNPATPPVVPQPAAPPPPTASRVPGPVGVPPRAAAAPTPVAGIPTPAVPIAQDALDPRGKAAEPAPAGLMTPHGPVTMRTARILNFADVEPEATHEFAPEREHEVLIVPEDDTTFERGVGDDQNYPDG